MKTLEIGDIIQRTEVDNHTDKPDKVTYEQSIDRVTKKFAFGGNWKFSRKPMYGNVYERHGGVGSHYIVYKLKTEE